MSSVNRMTKKSMNEHQETPGYTSVVGALAAVVETLKTVAEHLQVAEQRVQRNMARGSEVLQAQPAPKVSRRRKTTPTGVPIITPPPDLAKILESVTSLPEQIPEPEPQLSPAEQLRQQIELALHREAWDVKQLSITVGAPIEAVQDVLRTLREQGKIHNVGFGDHPRWIWKIGDETSTPELTEMIRNMVASNPMTTNQINEATGASPSRVQGVLVHLQRTKEMSSVPGIRPYIWFIDRTKSNLNRDSTAAKNALTKKVSIKKKR